MNRCKVKWGTNNIDALHSDLSQASHVSGKFADGKNDSTSFQLSRHFRTRWIYRTMTPPKPSSHLAVAAGNGNSSVPDRDQLVPIVSDWVSEQPGLASKFLLFTSCRRTLCLRKPSDEARLERRRCRESQSAIRYELSQVQRSSKTHAH